MSHLKSVHLKSVCLKSVLSKIRPSKKRRGPSWPLSYSFIQPKSNWFKFFKKLASLQCFWNCQPHDLLSRTFLLSHSHPSAHIHTHSLSLSHYLTHTSSLTVPHTRTPTLSLSLSHYPTHTLSLTISHTHSLSLSREWQSQRKKTKKKTFWFLFSNLNFSQL